MTLPQEVDVAPTGLTVLNPELPPDKALVDIVFVHGLGGHPQKTWTYKGQHRDLVSDESKDDVIDRLSRNEGEGANETDPSAHPTATSEVVRQREAVKTQEEELDQEEPSKRTLLKHLKNPFAHLSSSSSRSKGKAKDQTQSQSADMKRAAVVEKKAFGEDGAKKTSIKENTFFWPQHLPETCVRARVMTFGYDSDVTKFFRGAVNQNTFYDHARDLLGALVRKRTNAHDRPIIFVAHSLGGLVVKQMLFEAERAEALPQRHKVYLSTRALFFLGTPHRGSDWTRWGEIATSLAGVIFDTNSSSIKHLKVNGEHLMQLENNFGLLVYRRTFWVYTFTEAKCFQPLPFLKSKIVNENYATVGDQGREQIFTINANHTAMCRFWGKMDPGYEIVAGELSAFVHENFVRVDSKASQKREIEEKLRQEALLKSLDFEGRRDRDDQLWQIEANPETVQWIWSSSFADWTSEAGGLFWICGKPASGKSTLMEYIARDGELRDRLKRGMSAEWTVVHHFFFDYGVKGDFRNNFEGLLRSLLYQFAKDDLDLGGVNLPRDEPVQRWSIRALKERLTAVLKQRSNPICILLDGLDEYQEDECDKWDLARFLRKIASPRVKLCVASRPDTAFDNVFKDLQTIKMQDQNTSAIAKMVTLTIQRSVAGSGFYKDYQVVELAKSISEKAHGVFLWARFAVNELRDGWSKGLDLVELEKKLEAVPEELENVYARIFRKLEPAEKRQAAHMLQLVCYAKRILTMRELYVATRYAPDGQVPVIKEISALDIQRFGKRIFATTGGVLEVLRSSESYESQETDDSESSDSQETDDFESDESQETNKVNLIHRTVRTYLDSNGWSQILGEAHEGMLHAEVLWLRVCGRIFSPSLKELPMAKGNNLMSRGTHALLGPHIPSSSDAELSSIRPLGLKPCSRVAIKFSPLLKYAARYMLHHAEELERRLGLSSYDMLQSSLSNYFLCYHQRYWHRSCACFRLDCPEPSHPLHLAIAHGLNGYVKDFLSILCRKTSPGSREWDDVFSLEVTDVDSYGSPLEIPGSFRMSLLGFAVYQSPEKIHSRASQTSIVSLLLDQYSSPRDNEMIIALQSSSAEIVRLMLRHWPDGKMLLRSNVLSSDKDLVEDVLQSSVLEFCQEIFDFRPLWYIARRDVWVSEDNEELIDLFMRRGEDINDQCGPFGTALHGCLLRLGNPCFGHTATCNMLLAKGADINASGPLRTPLEFVWRLANTVNITSGFVLSRYMWAVQWLIENDAVNNKPDPNGSVPSRARMLGFGKSGMEGYHESLRLYRGNHTDDETCGDDIDDMDGSLAESPWETTSIESTDRDEDALS